MVKGHAKINGAVTPTGGTIFSGDQVATGANTVAELLLNGGSKILLPEASAVVVSNDAAQVIVNLNQGALAVLSENKSPTFVEVNGARIRPGTSSPEVLEVAVRGNVVKVLARRGTATVETADKTLEVAEGKELDATMAPAPMPSPGPQGVTRIAGRGKLETYVFITAVAAGVTGLVLGVLAIARPNPTDCTFVSNTGKIVCP
jgi:ferric-dicitrate binding protein FerR (iron transport regulator)